MRSPVTIISLLVFCVSCNSAELDYRTHSFSTVCHRTFASDGTLIESRDFADRLVQIQDTAIEIKPTPDLEPNDFTSNSCPDIWDFTLQIRGKDRAGNLHVFDVSTGISYIEENYLKTRGNTDSTEGVFQYHYVPAVTFPTGTTTNSELYFRVTTNTSFHSSEVVFLDAQRELLLSLGRGWAPSGLTAAADFPVVANNDYSGCEAYTSGAAMIRSEGNEIATIGLRQTQSFSHHAASYYGFNANTYKRIVSRCPPQSEVMDVLIWRGMEPVLYRKTDDAYEATTLGQTVFPQ